MSYKWQISTALAASVFFVMAGDPVTHGIVFAQSQNAKMPGMPSMPAKPGDVVEHSAVGTLNAIDRDKGTVNISHNAVATAQWPAMTMTFKLASPATVPADITAGQKVSFKFTIESGMSATVTSIEKAK
jgi:Cu(I)/Ag(I) efflux system protein CusF